MCSSEMFLNTVKKFTCMVYSWLFFFIIKPNPLCIYVCICLFARRLDGYTYYIYICLQT